MIQSERVGLFLQREDERQRVRDVSLDCGLEPEDLPIARTRATIPLPDAEFTQQLLTAVDGLQWVVTDDPALAEEVHSLATNRGFLAAQLPLLILVRDAAVSAEREPAAWVGLVSGDAGFIGVMERPLQVDTMRLQLRQWIRAGLVFAERHYGVSHQLRLAQRIFESVSNGISLSDALAPDLPLIYVNPAFERMTGYTADEVQGRNCRFLQNNDTQQPGLTKVREAIHGERETRALLKNYRKDGTPFWNELYLSPIFNAAGTLTHFVGIQNEVTKLVESQEQLTYLAHHDSLTGLANRGLLMEQLDQALLRARRNNGQVAVLFFDIDNFKHVNDMFGHEAGDRLLQAVADRLRIGTRANETVARLGGDEFIVVLEEYSDEHPPVAVMERLLQLIAAPVAVIEPEFHPSASAGMAIYPIDGVTSEALIKMADFKMYRAKHEARRASQNEEHSADLENDR